MLFADLALNHYSNLLIFHYTVYMCAYLVYNTNTSFPSRFGCYFKGFLKCIFSTMMPGIGSLTASEKSLKFCQVTVVNYFLNLPFPILFHFFFQKGNFNIWGVSVHPYLASKFAFLHTCSPRACTCSVCTWLSGKFFASSTCVAPVFPSMVTHTEHEGEVYVPVTWFPLSYGILNARK